ncbi:MAG: winged helix-turn-helix transcriptional regulator, partial [Candidatus Heimdallarchaeaceae archaeon]
MKGFALDLMEILRLLENYPLASYSELAQKISVSPQTFIRRVEELKTQDVIREVHSSLNPESLLLERHIVIFLTESTEGIRILELSCDVHPYTSSRNRIFGSEYGLYAVFDIPKGSFRYLKIFLENLLEKKYCEKYHAYKSQGIRKNYPQPFHNNIMDLEEFDLEAYLVQKTTLMYTGKGGREYGRELSLSSLNLHPIDLLILRDITLNFRTPMSQLINKYRKYLKSKKGELKEYIFPEIFRPHLEEFFRDERTENAIYLDFKKRYHSLIQNHVENYWLGMNRKYFEMFIGMGYLIRNISKEEKARLFSLLENERPPFSIYMEDLGKNLFISVSLPPYYQTRFAYFMKKNYEKLSVYLLDSFGYNALKYRFYV